MRNKNVFKKFFNVLLFMLFYTFCACIKHLSESSYLGFVVFVSFVRIKNKIVNFSIKQTKKTVLNALKKIKKHLRGRLVRLYMLFMRIKNI